MFVNKPSAKMGILFTKIRENPSEDRVIISISDVWCSLRFYRWYTTLLSEIHHPINIQYFIPYFCVCENLFDVRYFLRVIFWLVNRA